MFFKEEKPFLGVVKQHLTLPAKYQSREHLIKEKKLKGKSGGSNKNSKRPIKASKGF